MEDIDFWRLATFVSIFLLLAVILSWLCFWTQNKNRKRKLRELSAQRLPLQELESDKLVVPDVLPIAGRDFKE